MTDSTASRHPSPSLGERDTKQMARALHAAIKTRPPQNLQQCVALVQDAWRFREGEVHPMDVKKASTASLPEPFEKAPAGADAKKAFIESRVADEHPETFFSLGSHTDAKANFPGPPSHLLSWTHQGALEHGVMLGDGAAGQKETLFAMMRAAAKKDTGLFYFSCHDAAMSQARARGLATELQQPERVRLIDLTGNGADSHTFNPFSRGSALELTELLLTVLPARPGRAGAVNDGHPTQLELIGWVSTVMTYLVWGRDLGLWSLDTRRLEQGFSWAGIEQAAGDTRPPRILQSMFSHAAKGRVGDALKRFYAPIEALLVDDLLAPVNAHYGRILHTVSTEHGTLRPDLDMREALEKKLWVFIEMPAASACTDSWQTWPGRLALAQLARLATATSTAKAASAPRPRATHVHSWLVGCDISAYAEAIFLDQLNRLGPRLGLACLWADRDYPSLNRVDGLADKATAIRTKFFMQADDLAPGHLHIVADSTLYRATVPLPDFQRQAVPDFIPAPFPGYASYTGVPNVDHQSRVLHERLSSASGSSALNLAWCQETLARMLGFSHWHDLTVSLSKQRLRPGRG